MGVHIRESLIRAHWKTSRTRKSAQPGLGLDRLGSRGKMKNIKKQLCKKEETQAIIGNELEKGKLLLED